MEQKLEDKLILMARSPDEEMNRLCVQILIQQNLSALEHSLFREKLMRLSTVHEDKQIWRTILSINQELWNLKPSTKL